jgi:hypothetical protein
MKTELVRLAENEPYAFVVLGMHRSGTSILTRLLSFAGVELPKSIIPPRDDNPKGFWESSVINKFNDRLLQHLSCNWYEMGGIDVSELIENTLFNQEAIDILHDEFNISRSFVLKDPRICRLMPFWDNVFKKLSIKIKFLIPFRSPVDTAFSLKKRDGFSLESGYWLWLRHFLDSERYSRGCHRVFINYSQMLNNWRKILPDISRKLSIDLMEPMMAVQDQIDQFIDPEISKATGYELEKPLAHEIKSVYEWALRSSEGDEAPSDLLDDIHDFVLKMDRLVIRPMSKLLYEKNTNFSKIENELNIAKDSALEFERQIEREIGRASCRERVS